MGFVLLTSECAPRLCCFGSFVALSLPPSEAARIESGVTDVALLTHTSQQGESRHTASEAIPVESDRSEPQQVREANPTQQVSGGTTRHNSAQPGPLAAPRSPLARRFTLDPYSLAHPRSCLPSKRRGRTGLWGQATCMQRRQLFSRHAHHASGGLEMGWAKILWASSKGRAERAVWNGLRSQRAHSARAAPTSG